MKTLRTIAAVIVAAVMVLGPTVVFAAATVTVSTNATTYQGLNPIQVTGTVTPAPTVSNTAVVITTKGPVGAVDIGQATVATGTGAYSYAIVPGGSTTWVSGTYAINATYGGPSGTGFATTTFTYNAAGTGQVTTTTVTTTITTAVSTATVTTTIPSSDAAALAQMQTTLSGIQNTLGTLSSGFNSLNTNLQAVTTSVNGLTSSLNTISSGVTNIQSTLSSLSTNLTTVNGIGNQLTSLNNAVNNNQTYVLVVAALAAITLVLELAILVRKLS